ncbi:MULTISPECIES: hypothetical protein [unclassified Sulfitobacter]|uniref:hypothetical protein n=1 Tax=unclassified Sulfitobacter TaxID=196795 RepID=UPI003744C889
MNFDERRVKAKSALVGFLSSFVPPRGLDDDAMKAQVQNIAEAFARRLPVTDASQYESNIEKTFTAVLDSHKGYAWPVQSEFVDAMPRSASVSGARVETYQADNKQQMARRMNSGQAVPESWVWGPSAWSLVSGGLVGREVMDSYRRSSVAKFLEVYSHDAYGMLQDKYGDLVGAYFAQPEEDIA